ncbi:B-cell antigen receptor complex-associated protein beta chain [Sardina pilchardus]|uniref:B-cell antigen receptor complex-associated protein beta chain n=1 Tax=Sardina pilchardus TaxID=27697 RepID=UPI002E15FBB9
MRNQIVFLFIMLVDASVSPASMQLYQWPRFVGVKSGRIPVVTLGCKSYVKDDLKDVEWLKAPLIEGQADNAHLLEENDRVHFGERKGWLTLTKLEPADSGIYFCRVNGTKGIMGPGSEIQVHRPRNLDKAIRRSNMKDVVIFLQAFLLGLFLLIPRLCFKQELEKKENVYEVPDEDHTYEGLDIEQCGLYEDIPAFSQQDADEPCDMSPESPDQE